MAYQNIETSGFMLAKGKHLKGDDFFEVKVMENLTVAVLCDGVGSALQGAQAASHTVVFLINALKNRPKSWTMEKSIKHFIETINRVLYLESITQYGRQDLVTTLALVVIEGDRLYGANVGDSRIYLRRSDEEDALTQLSHDHVMQEEGMSNVLTMAIGLEEHVSPYYFENNLLAQDQILLCSDGLYTVLSQKELLDGMMMGASFLVKQASNLHQDNLPDDTSAVVIEIKEVDPRFKLKQSNLLVKPQYVAQETIDGYTLLKPLIQNERTWLCEKNGLQYVIKFAPYETLEDEALLDLFVKEAWMAKRLKAGFFPKAAIPKNRTQRYYVMSYIEGVTLKAHTIKKPLSVELGIELGMFLLKMSQFLIKYDLVHGDIKPENIMLTQCRGKTVFKMVDFGSITEAYTNISRAGTPIYLAPERFRQEPINEQAEIYAIGVTLYEALTQKYPFGEIEPFQNPSFDRKIKAPSKLNPNIPTWLESIMLRALETDTDKRYRNYSVMQYELTHPSNVKPYFDKHTSFIERNPLLVCRIGFVAMLVLNFVQMVLF